MGPAPGHVGPGADRRRRRGGWRSPDCRGHGAWVSSRSAAPASGESSPSAPSPRSAIPGVGPSRTVHGVPAGYAHTRAGALAAALNYIGVVGNPAVLLDAAGCGGRFRCWPRRSWPGGCWRATGRWPIGSPKSVGAQLALWCPGGTGLPPLRWKRASPGCPTARSLVVQLASDRPAARSVASRNPGAEREEGRVRSAEVGRWRGAPGRSGFPGRAVTGWRGRAGTSSGRVGDERDLVASLMAFVPWLFAAPCHANQTRLRPST